LVIMLVMACVGIFASIRSAGTVEAAPEKHQMVTSTEKTPRDRHLFVGEE
jgi:hypothetical protein